MENQPTIWLNADFMTYTIWGSAILALGALVASAKLKALGSNIRKRRIYGRKA